LRLKDRRGEVRTGLGVRTLVVVLLLCAAVVAAVAVWGAHRRTELTAWNRELEAAFQPVPRELSRRRVL
jgi:hypothetical protein